MRKDPYMESRTILDSTGHTLFKVRYVTARGEVIEKTLTPDAYAKVVGGSVKEDRSYWRIRRDFLPEGFIDGAISDDSNYIIAFKVPGMQRFFAHTSGNYSIPYPDLLFVLELKKGCVNTKLCFALKGEDGMLYHYPFGNVSSSGSICTGSIELDEVRKYGPGAFSELFFLGKTNNDYVSAGVPVNGKFTQQELLEKLDGKKKFPSRLLTPMKGEYTRLADIKKLISKRAV